MSTESVPYRKRVRAEGFDYAQSGWYFVTICTQDRRCRFGSISNGVIDLSLAGQMVYDELQYLPERFDTVGLDVFVVMPNHIHGIIILGPDDDGHSPVSLSDVVSAYKRITTNSYIRKVKEEGWPPFPGRLWQRSFHDRIIRSDRHSDRLRDYIEANPFLWTKDTYYKAVD
jgi:REP element-mobilizing transposase RayT